jgi:hypothetical protein
MALMSSSNDAAEFVRSWLRGHSARITQDEMQSLISDLKATLGRALSRAEIDDVVEAFREVAERSEQPRAAA